MPISIRCPRRPSSLPRCRLSPSSSHSSRLLLPISTRCRLSSRWGSNLSSRWDSRSSSSSAAFNANFGGMNNQTLQQQQMASRGAAAEWIRKLWRPAAAAAATTTAASGTSSDGTPSDATRPGTVHARRSGTVHAYSTNVRRSRPGRG